MTRTVTMMQMTLVLVATALAGWVWTQLPAEAKVPVHWGPDLRVDRWADKSIGLFIVPVVASVLVGASAIAASRSVRWPVLRTRAFAICTTGVVALLMFVHAMVLLTALGREPSMSRALPLGLGAFFLVIGNWLPKVARNPLFGLRTPWTVTSDHVWDKTHRMGGRLFVGWGAAQLVTAVVNPQASVQVILLGAVGIVGWSLIYSYTLARAPTVRSRVGQHRSRGS